MNFVVLSISYFYLVHILVAVLFLFLVLVDCFQSTLWKSGRLFHHPVVNQCLIWMELFELLWFLFLMLSLNRTLRIHTSSSSNISLAISIILSLYRIETLDMYIPIALSTISWSWTFANIHLNAHVCFYISDMLIDFLIGIFSSAFSVLSTSIFGNIFLITSRRVIRLRFFLLDIWFYLVCVVVLVLLCTFQLDYAFQKCWCLRVLGTSAFYNVHTFEIGNYKK